jgi:hypothetical protein
MAWAVAGMARTQITRTGNNNKLTRLNDRIVERLLWPVPFITFVCNFIAAPV